MSIEKTNTSVQLETLVFNIASNVFNDITPLEQQSKVSKEDVAIALNNLSSVVNSKKAFSYLTEGDNYYMRSLTAAIDSGMRNVLKDSKITISDTPAILKMVKDVVNSVNNINSKRNAIVQISQHSLMPLLQAIICITAQMILTSGQYELARGIILMAFELLDTTLEPLLKKCNWSLCIKK